MKRLVAAALLIAVSRLHAQSTPHKIYFEQRSANAPLIMPYGVSMMSVSRTDTVRKQMHKSCPDEVAEAPVATLADYFVVMKDRGADLIAKDGTLLLHSNARSEHKNGMEFCKYFTGLSR